MTRLTLQGLPISPGLGIAPVFRYPHLPFRIVGNRIAPEGIPSEIRRLEQAIEAVRGELGEDGTAPCDGGATPVTTDPLFRGGIIDRIRSGMPAEDAVVQTTHDLIAIFGEMPDPLLRARAETAEETGRRLFRRLHGLPTPVLRTESPVILAIDEMTPFDASRLRPGAVAGVLAEQGGATSHFAIIAKQLGIPVVSGIRNPLDALRDGELCILDGTTGTVRADPDEAHLDAARDRIERHEQDRAALIGLGRMKTTTRTACRSASGGTSPVPRTSRRFWRRAVRAWVCSAQNSSSWEMRRPPRSVRRSFMPTSSDGPRDRW